MISKQAELIRLKYKYRKLILSGKMKLPQKEAARLIGPDCAYHLYAQEKSKATNIGKKKST